MRLDAFRSVRSKLLDANQPIGGRRARVRAAIGLGADPDDHISGNAYYERVTGGGRTRDLPDALRTAGLERAIEFADSNPLIARYQSFVLDWTRPRDFRPRARDERVDEVVQEFWTDPRNCWGEFLAPLMRAKLSSGTVALPCILDRDSRVVVDYWDPADIVDVKFAEGSNRIRGSVGYRASNTVGEVKQYPIVRPWYVGRGTTPAEAGRLIGNHPATTPAGSICGVLYFAFNALPNARQGRSDYFSSLDYLMLLDDLHHAFADRSNLLARYSGSVRVEGQDVDEYKQEVQNIQGMASVLVHNEAVTAQIGAPPAGAMEAKEQERMLRVYGASPLGIPPHLLSGDFTEGNRAIAAGTEDPSYMRGTTQQDELALILETACRYAVDTAYTVRPARFSGVANWEIDIERPRLLTDPEAAARTLGTLVDALAAAVEQGYLDQATARGIYIRAVNELGVDIVRPDDVEAELPSSAGPQPVEEPAA